jgi:dihydroorotase
MNTIIRAAKIIDTGSSHHNTVKDLLIENGVIKKIGSNIRNTQKFNEIKFSGLHVSLGWVDMNSFFADPGFEYKETIASGSDAAVAGGYTHVCVMPNTEPAIQSKSLVEYVLSKASFGMINLLPVGALTQNCEGNELADLYDMFDAGAVAFSDGLKTSPTAGMVERALLYVKAFDGLIMLHPEDKSISKNGTMHEGKVSTLLGLPATPAFAEEIAVARDLYVLEYTNSRLHFLDVSVKKSAELIKAAKKKGLKVSASVNAYNLWASDEAVGSYNTNWKVNPPLRPKVETDAIIKAIKDGTIDTITSQHRPQDEESKKLEFDKADFGIEALETAFAVANTRLHEHLDITDIVNLFSKNARNILNIKTNHIEEQVYADLTLFAPDLKWKFEAKDIKSRSKNSPFVGEQLIGKPLGIFSNGYSYLSNHLIK